MNSMTLKLSVILVVLASICYSAPIVDQTTMESELFETREFVPRPVEEKNEIDTTETTKTERAEEEMTTMAMKTSTKSSLDKESEGDESRETREFDEMNTSQSSMVVTEKSTLYPTKDSQHHRMATIVPPRSKMETERVPVVSPKSEMRTTEKQIQRESTTTMKMTSTSTSTSSSSSSTVAEKYLGRLEDQNEPSENVETTTKPSRRVTKKPMKYQEEEKQEYQQPAKKLEKEREQPVKELEQEVPVTEESEVKGNYKMAEYDPKALDSISTLETVRMQYDENNQSVSYVPFELTTMESSDESDHRGQTKHGQKEKTLDQAQESPIVEEEKSNH